MPLKPKHSSAYHGPLVILTLGECQRVAHALRFAGDEDAKRIKRKISVAANSDPQLRQPHR